MNTKTLSIDTQITLDYSTKPRMIDGLARRIFFRMLSELKDGQLTIRDGRNEHCFGAISQRCQISVEINVTSPAFYSDVVFGGSIGAGESYIKGFWHTDDLTGLVRILACNRDILDQMDSRYALVTRPLLKAFHWFNRNTQKNSRRNIAAHYDLGNDFFARMLDETMMYSCAIFDRADMSLYQAQLNRLDHICSKLDLKPTDHLLEIGTGWGSLAIYAAKHYGCHVTTTTISIEQYELAISRISEAGVENQVKIFLDDYRNLEGQFDKLVSIEMIEAVGHEYYDVYFDKCSKLLKPEGLMLLQAITIADQNYQSAKKSVDFIQRYIFPGSCIPSITAMLSSITRSSDLRLTGLDDIGPHYATTLRKWRENIYQHFDEIRDLGYTDQFLRMWEFYLCYCEGGFTERAISDVHMVLVKPDNRM